MSKKFLVALLTFLVIGATFALYFNKGSLNPLDERASHHRFVIAQAHHLLGFDLVDPAQAPPHVRNSVMRGYRLIMNTPFYAPNYARDQLSCTHCHFAGGDTIGGKNNGISLVGVTAIYPQFSSRDGKIISLADRINNCFERSLNGRPLPVESQEMQDILAYLTWISQEVQSLKKIPWLGLSFLKSPHQPNAQKGEQTYNISCALCHKRNGEGGGVLSDVEGKTIPPLWGPYAFNDGAGMSHLSMLAAFIYWNMPYEDASLSEEEALDVAAFILQQPRSHFIKD